MCTCVVQLCLLLLISSLFALLQTRPGTAGDRGATSLLSILLLLPLLHCSCSFLFLGYPICLHLTVFTSTVLFLSSSLLSLPSPPFSFPFISSAFRFPLIFSFSLISFPFLSCCFFSPSPLHSLPLISPLSLLPSPLLEQS